MADEFPYVGARPILPPQPLSNKIRRTLAHITVPMTYVVEHELTSPKFGRSFSIGCLGPTTTDLSGLVDNYAFAGFCTPPTWPLLDRAIAQGRNYYYGDHGWFGRGKYYRVAKNAVQWRPTEEDLRAARPHRYELVRPETVHDWDRNGTSIVICPNSPQYMARFGIDAKQWTLDVAEQVSRVSSRPIVIRWKASANRRPLAIDLHTAWIVIVYSSGAAVEALRAGIPIITLADWATTRMMGLTDLTLVNQPIYPASRMAFLHALAERQWTLPELAAGVAWRDLHKP